MRNLAVPVIALGVLLSGCAVEPSTENLRESFSDQIAAIELVEDFVREGDDISFTRLDGAGDQVEWTIHIDSLSLEPYDDPATPFRGIVRSTWRVNGRPVISQGDISGLPQWVLETGISQDCWAFWESEPRVWSWL